MIRSFLHRFRHVPWVLSGILLFACFPPVSRVAYIAFALVPFLLMVRHRSPGFCFRWGFLSGFVYWFATLKWLCALEDMLGNPALLVLFGWAALAAYCALYFGLFGYLAAGVWTWVRERTARCAAPAACGLRLLAILVAEPLLWAGLELLRAHFGTGFAWNNLGTVPAVMGLGAPAAFGGVYLLSMLVVLMNGSVASIVERCYQSVADFRRARLGGEGATASLAVRLPRWMRSVETLVPFLLVFAVYLGARASVGAQVTSADKVSVALFQRDFPPPFTDSRRAERLEKGVSGRVVYAEMADGVKALKPNLLVLSESAMSEVAGDVTGPRAQAFAGEIMRRSGATAVLSGGAREDGGEKTFNSAALYQADLPVQVYDKVHLVPFGEYVPGASLVPALGRLLPLPSCTPGEVKTLDLALAFPGLPALQRVPVGVAICYEDTDAALMRQMAERGARMLVFITNDSWFYGSDEPEQHAWQAVVRAIETGLPVVRVGNYGVTGFVDPHGAPGRQCRVRWLRDGAGRLEVNARERMVVDVTLASSLADRARTAYVRWGDGPVGIAFLLLILTMGVVKYKASYEKRRKLSL